MSAESRVEPAAPIGAERARLPTGTITFLFSDIEGSTRLLQEIGPDYPAVLADHDRLMEESVARAGGHVFGHEGDAVFAAFGDAASAVSTALDAQRALAAHPWSHGRPVRVRMGVHTGEAIVSGNGYIGLPLHQVARICSSAHGGQVIVSEATRRLALGGLDPSVELRDLGEHRLKDLARPERLYELVAPDLPPHPERPRTISAQPNNLPLQLTSFVGRAEIDESRRLLAGARLLTLTGPGGTGKTRLALQLAAETMADFPDGTWFVPLDAVDDANLVPSAIAHTLGLELGAEPPLERLARDLRDKRTLLVLDNFEQVVGAAPVVSRLLREAAGIKIVVTSRIVLRASGEQEFAVPPLSLDEGVRLFVERAAAAQSHFRLDDSNADAIRDIVTRLDALPLAIELAAARTRVLSVDALRARLDQRLAVLVGGPRDLPARQQTLRGAIDWSYDLLEEPDRRLFERSSVFSGGAGLTQVDEVCGPASEIGGEVLDGLGSLVEKSLLRSMPSIGDDPRFAMLATIREYATERLGQRDDEATTRSRHARAYLAIAESCAPHLVGPDAGRFLDSLELDHDNLRAAIDWAIATGEAEIAHRIGAALWRFWQVRGHLPEARARLSAILDMPGSGAVPPAIRSRAHGAAGSLAYWSGDEEATIRQYELALDEARESGDQALLAEATYNAGFSPVPDAGRRVRYAGGGPHFREARGLYQQIGDEPGVANATWALAIAELAGGQPADARVHLEESLVLYRKLGQPFGLGWALHMLGLMDILAESADDAEPRFREALESFWQTGDLSAVVLLLQDFALVARLRGRMDRFWTLSAASETLALKTGTGLGATLEDFIDVAPPTRPGDDDPDAQKAWDAGTTLSTDDAIAFALAGDAAG